MDTKLKKSRALIGFISLFTGAVMLGMNLVVLFCEISCYDNFMERARGVLEEDYQNMGGFRESISDYLDIFLSMSIAEEDENEGKISADNGDTSGKPEETKAESAEEEIEGRIKEGTYAYETESLERTEGIDSEGSDWDMEYEVWDEYDWDEYDEDYYEDYYEGYYNDYYGFHDNYYYRYNDEYGFYMDKKRAEGYHKALKGNRNILYRVEKSGEILYTNEENLGFDEGAAGYRYEIEGKSFVMPEGYNFLLYFDGKKVRIWKDGFEIDVYGDGFYRKESQWYVPGYKNFEADEVIKDSRVYIAAARMPGIFIRNGYEKESDRVSYNNNQWYDLQEGIKREKAAYLRWISSTIFAVAMLFLGYLFRKERWEINAAIGRFTGKIWYEIKIIPLLIVLFGFWISLMVFIHELHWMGRSYFYDIRDGYVYVPKRYMLLYAGWLVGIFIIWIFVNDRRYNKKGWRTSLTGKVIGLCRTSMLKLPASRRMVRRSIGVCLFVWAMCAAGLCYVILLEGGVFTAGLDVLAGIFLLAVMICCPVLFVISGRKTAEDVDNLVEQIQSIHDGELREEKMMWEGSGLGKAMENLNDIRNGMNEAVQKQMKSERMKVELVANVSHDIKTPLTSIISYVELLKQEEGLPEHVKEYILILENKSQRLKSMVQDVFEVSKAASGNLPVNLEELDLGKLLRQTIADMGEQIENSSVRLKTEIPESAVMICADGERVYRVFQNLIQNALRYSLEGSRVYVTLREDGRTAIASVKNTSREELPAGMDFTERFTRGDESRSDGGSGLGLSIARSFTEACGGSFKVETIADLFVVTVIFPERREEGGMSFIQKD